MFLSCAPCRAGAAGAASDAGVAASWAQLRSLWAQLEVTAEAEAEARGRAALQATEIHRLQGKLSVPPRLVPLPSLLASAPFVAAFTAQRCISVCSGDSRSAAVCPTCSNVLDRTTDDQLLKGELQR